VCNRIKTTGEELVEIVKLVQNAIRITEWFKKRGFESFVKMDKSPVTLADYASQIYIISKLKYLYPNDSIIAEETYNSKLNMRSEKLILSCYNTLNLSIETEIKDILNYRGPKSKRHWSIDPIDGTKGYQKGLSYAIGIGLIENYQKISCVIGVPNYNSSGMAIFVANKDHGAKASYGGGPFTAIKVSDQKSISQFRFCHSLHYDEPWVLKLAQILGIEKYVQIDSMAKFCMVADSSADVYVKPMNKDRSFIWDFLPGDLLVNEAGGKVTDLKGYPPKYIDDKCVISAPGLVVSNGKFHEEIIEAIKTNFNIFN
jgi:3'(2'), 5'-bisphosphate nucleotidase